MISRIPGEPSQGRRMYVLSSAAMLVLALTGCGLGGPAYTTPQTPGVAVVDMTTGMTFSPATITIARGQTVEWRNTSLFPHTVTADPAKAKNPANVVLPAGAAPFDSGRVEAGGVYRRTFDTPGTYRFDTPGTYRYVCVYHEEEGMIGTVVVQ